MKGIELIQLIRDNQLRDFDFEYILPNGKTHKMQSVNIKPFEKRVLIEGEQVTEEQMNIEELE